MKDGSSIRTVMKQSRLALVVALVVTMCCVELSQAQEAAVSPQPIHEFGSMNNHNLPSTDNGILFLDGEYVPPPYEIQLANNGIFLNGRDISKMLPVATSHRHRVGYFGGPRMRVPPFLWVARGLRNNLEFGGIVLIFAGDAPMTLSGDSEYCFCQAVLAVDDRAALLEQLCDYLPDGADEERWRKWLSTFAAPDELSRQLQERIDSIDSVVAANAAQNDAVRRLSELSYPLTVAGMVLATLSIGHLLRSQSAGTHLGPTNTSVEAKTFLVRSLMLVITFSALDLAWTILASQAGQMRELNPIGSRLIESPLALIGFKFAITCGAASLLFHLRQYRRAQAGAWWACLICTLLTLRWLVFNSLFVS